MKELTIDATIDNLAQVIAFAGGQLELQNCPKKVQMQIEIAVEEIFVNIANYAYTSETGQVTVRVEGQKNPAAAVITFLDRGMPYNPLQREEPDITLPAEERAIGGLGIFMVKKSMDAVNYQFKDGQNILTVTKRF